MIHDEHPEIKQQQDYLRFLNEFHVIDGTSLYDTLLQNVIQTRSYSLYVNLEHMKEFDEKLYQTTVKYPEEMIPFLRNAALSKVLSPDFFDSDIDKEAFNESFICSVFGMPKEDHQKLRDLEPEDICRLITIEGLVIHVSPIVLDMRMCAFQCSSCGYVVIVKEQDYKIKEPEKCDACKKNQTMALFHKKSIFSDRQVIRVQENINDIPEGEIPRSVSVVLTGYLLKGVVPGDRIKVTGIYRAQLPRETGGNSRRAVKSVLPTFIDATGIEKDKSSLGQGLVKDTLSSEKTMTKEMIEERNIWNRALGKRPDIVDLLIKSIAPSVYGHNDVKKGLLCQLFGGANHPDNPSDEAHKSDHIGSAVDPPSSLPHTPSEAPSSDFSTESQIGHSLDSYSQPSPHRQRGEKHESNGAMLSTRNEINVLLIGDPSTAKSQMLRYVHRIAPRGMMTSGSGSSAVGLTAYVTRDPDTDELVLESGALVMSDGGICCVDEFDKMSQHARTILHEAMEQQSISVAKAGIVCTLRARTAILAAANPQHSRYNTQMTVLQNIALPATLLSRFDLIFLLLDIPEESRDREFSRHLVSLFQIPPTDADDRKSSKNRKDRQPENNITSIAAPKTKKEIETEAKSVDILTQEQISEYILYARQHCFPKITEQAKETLINSYVQMRERHNSEKSVRTTLRQLDSLMRVSTSLARMQLSPSVSVDNAVESVALVEDALKRSAIDDEGVMNMDQVAMNQTIVPERY
ncbi:putative DNA replication licensing factor mcm4 [Blattamonas nauphoetae]|uniref:DNA replication licensing factor MCM4 n=1 Tax=Blattamonas nauphoetae TaxID=2049346 RepID=A0ABQ9XXB2_9EUKA|nr:putative DNA replication licensing factor mcm4 [Blattamonas nauphoetae]